jgi:hypothetical protein
VQVYFSLAQAPWRSGSGGRALDEINWRATESWLEADLGRWQSLAVAQRPALQEASLRWQEGRLENAGASSLAEVYVLGWGAQDSLAPGASLEPVASDAPALPEAYAGLAEQLPEGAALASRGAQIHVALPPPADTAASVYGERVVVSGSSERVMVNGLW